MEFTSFTYHEEGRTGILTLNRPQLLNALNQAFLSELNQLLKQLEEREDPPVLILTGSGKAFAAGADISEMVGMKNEEARQFSLKGQQTLSRLEDYPSPVIAAINGYALGGGLELAMACDIRLASEEARMGMPEASLGLIPGFGGTRRLPRLAGLGNAMYILLTGDTITAAEALQMGLVQQVCPHHSLGEKARKLASTIANRGPRAVRHIKRTVRRGMQLPRQDAFELEASNLSSLFESEGLHGMQAFLDKRKPSWEKSKSTT